MAGPAQIKSVQPVSPVYPVCHAALKPCTEVYAQDPVPNFHLTYKPARANRENHEPV